MKRGGRMNYGNRDMGRTRDIICQNAKINDAFIELKRLLKEDKKKFFEKIEEIRDTCLKDITQSQLRNLYDIVVDMDVNDPKLVENKLWKLRIMLEYAHRKDRTKVRDEFYCPMRKLIEETIENVKDKKDVESFILLFEALIAYSKLK
jgi:CRISPR type III-A-associated protein Csm2